jgi:hypothetical protein
MASGECGDDDLQIQVRLLLTVFFFCSLLVINHPNNMTLKLIY